MRRILCLSSGIALFCVAGVLYVAGNQNNQPGMRAVGDNEAELVIGGGNYGVESYESAKCGMSGTNGCDAWTGKDGIGTGTQILQHFHSCGGTCGVVGYGTPITIE
jgi:hypothetical protein